MINCINRQLIISLPFNKEFNLPKALWRSLLKTTIKRYYRFCSTFLSIITNVTLPIKNKKTCKFLSCNSYKNRYFFINQFFNFRYTLLPLFNYQRTVQKSFLNFYTIYDKLPFFMNFLMNINSIHNINVINKPTI